jgi:hypothetical protein
VFWGVYAPLGAATTYAYKPLRFAKGDEAVGCRFVKRGERVSIWPAGTAGGEPLVRLVEAPRCVALLSDMSTRPRPELRSVEEGRWRFAVIRDSAGKRLRGRVKRYTRVNARREPDLDSQFIIEPLDSLESIQAVAGVVTGTDNMDWLEVTLGSGQTAYIKRNLLEKI